MSKNIKNTTISTIPPTDVAASCEFVKNCLQFIPDLKVVNVKKDKLNKDALIVTISLPKVKSKKHSS